MEFNGHIFKTVLRHQNTVLFFFCFCFCFFFWLEEAKIYCKMYAWYVENYNIWYQDELIVIKAHIENDMVVKPGSAYLYFFVLQSMLTSCNMLLTLALESR